MNSGMEDRIGVSFIGAVDVVLAISGDKQRCRITVVDNYGYVRIHDADIDKCILLFSTVKAALQNGYIPEYYHKQSIKEDDMDPYLYDPFDVHISGRDNDMVIFLIRDHSFSLYIKDKDDSCVQLQKLINFLYRYRSHEL